MPFAVFALAAVNFAIGTQSFVFAGLLAELAADLAVTVGTAGLLVTASAVTFAVGAPIAAMLVAKMERKRVIVIGLIVLAIANILCSFAPSFQILLGLRVLGGIATAFVGSLATVAVTSLVPADKRGRAFALVLGGLTVAFVLGVPLGSVVGSFYGWRATFSFSAAVALFSALLIFASVPRIDPVPGAKPRYGTVLRDGQILRVFALTLLGFTATFTVVSFLGPAITYMTGATGAGIGALQAFIGLGSILGLIAGGILADRKATQPGLIVAFAIMAASLVSYGWTLGAEPRSIPYAIVALQILVGASMLFAIVPINLARLTELAGPATPVALALNGSLVSLGQGLGAVWGGAITDAAGFSWIGPGGAALALCGVALAAGLHHRFVARAAE